MTTLQVIEEFLQTREAYYAAQVADSEKNYTLNNNFAKKLEALAKDYGGSEEALFLHQLAEEVRNA